MQKAYSGGASNPSDIRTRDLTIGAIAVQSGGLVLNPGNDLAGDLQKCIADAAAYYEISFDPVITGQADEYHHLEIRVAKPGLTARTRQGYYSQPWPAAKFTAQSASLASAGANKQSYSANVQPYLDEPLAQLIERIPELKTLQPAADQQELPVILQKVGRKVDDFMHDVGDLIANEDVTQERLDAQGRLLAKQHVQDNYLILHHGYEWGANAEYRMDERGIAWGP